MLPEKTKAVKRTVLKFLREGEIRFSRHAEDRMQDHGFTRNEVRQSIAAGRHVEHFDEYDSLHHVWKYAMVGRTVDGDKEIRTAVVIDKVRKLVIVTAIPYEDGRGRKRGARK